MDPLGNIPLFLGPEVRRARAPAAGAAPAALAPGQTGSLLLALTIARALSGATLLSSTFFYRLLRERGLIAIERLMGMLLVMVAVQVYMDGVKAFLARGA